MLRKIRSLLFTNKSVGQTVAKNTFWLFAGEAIGRVFRSAIVIYAARVLGAAGYGAFSYAMATAGLVTILADVGISSILTRESVQKPEQRKQYFATALALKGVLIVLNITLILFAVPLFTTIPEARALLPLVAFILTFDTLREFGFSLLRALEKMEREAMIRIVMNMVIAGLGLFFLLQSATPRSLATGYVWGTGFGFGVTIVTLWPYFRDLFGHFNKSLVKGILTSAWPIGLLGILGAITINTDMIMLGWWRAPEEVGFYAAAQKPVQLLYIIPGLLASAVFPVFARLVHENKEKLRFILERATALTMMVAIPITLGGVLLSGEIIRLLYGEAYVASILSFQILLLTLLINSPASIINNAILAYDKQRYFLRFFAIGAIGNIIFNSFLIPPYGIAGAALATVLAQLIANVLIWKTMHRINPFTITPYLGKFVTASILMACVTLALKAFEVHFMANLFISAAAYFIFLVLLKEPLLRQSREIIRG